MRLFLTGLMLAILVLPLGGCLLPLPPRTALASQVRPEHTLNIFVASTRTRDADGNPGTGRADTLSYSVYDVSVPPERRLGRMNWPQSTSDPQTAFLTLGETPIASADAFNRAVVNEAGNVRNARDVLVFVHGFNSGFEKTVYRVAQLDADFDIPAAMVLYSWPSADKLSLYPHDTDAAAFARDGLEQLLIDLAASDVGKIRIVGHSMGALIVTETLRQMRFKGTSRMFNRIGGVAFVSPDIDVDLFVADARDIGRLPQPFVIYSSEGDWPLRGLVNWFVDGKERLGNLTDTSRLAGLEVTIVDTTNVVDVRDSYHSAALTSPAMIGLINSLPNVGLSIFGPQASAGAVAGAEILRNGPMTTIILPAPLAAQ